ncbi:MAG: septal ring lytic transglycosylase RlpA family protein [Chthoniobacterales bacterium]
MRQIIILLSAALLVAGCSTPSYRGYKHKPYTVRGVRYYPMSPKEAIGFRERGIASHYSEGNLLFPSKTAIGEKLRPGTKTSAHKTLPLPCVVRVTNLENGRKTVVRVSDRGPFIKGRIFDVTAPVAKKLGFYDQGLTRVEIEVLSVGDGRYKIRR